MFRCLLTVPRNRGLLSICTWQNESASIIGRSAKNRYISSRERSKTTFLSIIPELPASFVGLRQASTVVESVRSPEPSTSTSFLDVKIPYISQSDPQPLVQIPYVPDFWNSSSPSLIEPVSKETLPKLLVVAGVGTHHGGGPTHNLLDISSGPEYDSLGSVSADASSSHPEEGRGLWDDMADDVGLPPTKDVKKAIWKLFS